VRIEGGAKSFEFVVGQVKFPSSLLDNFPDVFIMNMADIWENMMLDLVV
jgi:hypothetical protein